MKNEVDSLIRLIQQESNPVLIAKYLGYFLSDALSEGKISLYEAYLLNWEKIKYKRMGYTQPAWSSWAQISTCLAILNQKLLAHIFEERTGAEILKDWGIEAFHLNRENREHYIMDRYTQFLDANNSPDLLMNLFEIRNRYDELSDDEGPYHTEVFPYHLYSPEEILLGNKGQINYEKNLNGVIEELIVELNMK